MTASTGLSKNNVAFGLAAAAACLFNTVLAWVKDSSPALNRTMAGLTGHHWITHGLADLVVFLAVALILRRSSVAGKMNADRVVSILLWSVVAASVGLFAWFLLF